MEEKGITRVIVAGASGMVGQQVLDRCLNHPDVDEVISFVRRSSGVNHSHLTEIVVEDFMDFSGHATHLTNVKAAFFCIGAYTGEVSDEVFQKITVDIPLALAKELKTQSPQASFCLLSGQGADRTEKSRVAFARLKGMAENQLSDMGLGGFYSFRPAYIYPVTPRKEPNFMYSLSRKLYPLIKLFGTNYSITSVQLGWAMVKVGMEGCSQEVLENGEILQLLEGHYQ